ncbi:hypothetical protein ACFX2A_037189 [Malus domestica]
MASARRIELGSENPQETNPSAPSQNPQSEDSPIAEPPKTPKVIRAWDAKTLEIGIRGFDLDLNRGRHRYGRTRRSLQSRSGV